MTITKRKLSARGNRRSSVVQPDWRHRNLKRFYRKLAQREIDKVLLM